MSMQQHTTDSVLVWRAEEDMRIEASPLTWLVAPDAKCATARPGDVVQLLACTPIPDSYARGVVRQVQRFESFAKASATVLSGDLTRDWYKAGCPPEGPCVLVQVAPAPASMDALFHVPKHSSS